MLLETERMLDAVTAVIRTSTGNATKSSAKSIEKS